MTASEPNAPSRTISLVRPLDQRGVGVFRVTVRERSCYYILHEIRCEIGGRGFEVHRLGIGLLYHVRVGRRENCTCECKGYLYRNVCRHVLGLLALMRQGKL